MNILKITASIILLILFFSCNTEMKHKYTNKLVNETSPYLLQHAHNPVNWQPWGKDALEQAKKENKPIIVSIGYAACHWCHVMEKESFEDEEVAAFMNKHFVCIKVDREERPDIDQVYMNAVQLMTGSGGWPLNVVTLPDGRPFWGGTYFKKEDWLNVLKELQKVYTENPEKVLEYATNLEKGIKQLDMVAVNPNKPSFTKQEIDSALTKWQSRLDTVYGGTKGAPKFMMPSNYSFLLRYAYQTQDSALLNHVNLTLTKMANGGIYDQIGGGFARYSVDNRWHIPHFEKMLYDNALLVSLYANAYSLTKNTLYKQIVTETLSFVETELTNPDGAFYSSLDADSEIASGELHEGAYYVWNQNELKTLLKDDFQIFKSYYNINDYGIWEHGNYVLIKTKPDTEIASEFNITVNQLYNKVASWKKTLLQAREKRAKPRLDDKSLTSWNALMLKAYTDAYKVFESKKYLDIALKNAEFIVKHQLKSDGGLYHSYKNGKSTINGYLEDYAAVIDAFISLYEITLDPKWLNHARDLTNYTFDHFFDDRTHLFYFTSDEDDALVSRSIEKLDNVIPSSNSIMANNLFKLSHFFGNESYLKTSEKMINNMKNDILSFPSSHSNWLFAMSNFIGSFYEIAVVGSNAKKLVKELNKQYIPNKLIVGSTTPSKMYLLDNKYVENQTLIYVCVNNTCKLPVSTVQEAIKQINTKL